MSCKKIFKAINEGFGKFGGKVASFFNNLFRPINSGFGEMGGKVARKLNKRRKK